MIQELLTLIPHTHSRPYKGGTEIRVASLDNVRDKAEAIIKQKGWPLEVFEVDIRVRSISVREKSI